MLIYYTVAFLPYELTITEHEESNKVSSTLERLCYPRNYFALKALLFAVLHYYGVVPDYRTASIYTVWHLRRLCVNLDI